jgi:hypothetical protein
VRRIVEEFIYSISIRCVLTYSIGILQTMGKLFKKRLLQLKGRYVCQSRMSYFRYVAEDRKNDKKWNILYGRSLTNLEMAACEMGQSL